MKSPVNQDAFDDLPGAELVRQGLVDLSQGVESRYSLLLSIARPRLLGLGIAVPQLAGGGIFEHRLYGLLEQEHGRAAHSQYNALLRRIVSFARALAREREAARGIR